MVSGHWGYFIAAASAVLGAGSTQRSANFHLASKQVATVLFSRPITQSWQR